MSKFYLFFGIEKRVLLEKKILLGVEQNSIDMYVGKNILNYFLDDRWMSQNDVL